MIEPIISAKYVATRDQLIVLVLFKFERYLSLLLINIPRVYKIPWVVIFIDKSWSKHKVEIFGKVWATT